MDKDKLKEKIAEAIYPSTVMTTEFEAVPFNEAMERPRHYGLRYRVMQAAEAALTAIEDAGQLLNAQKWREIETAPKDGTPVLICDARTDSVRWAVWALLPAHAGDANADFLGWRDGTLAARGEIVGVIPTHWLPLPSPPEDKENGDV